MPFTPTSEQQAALEAFRTGDEVTIEAGAGTGKTSTLKLLAADAPRRRGIYFAYNKAIAKAAAASFPRSVYCKTLHGLAYGPVARYRPHLIDRMNIGLQPSREVAEILGIAGPHRVTADIVLAPWQVASLVLETIKQFCYSSDEHVNRTNLPWRSNLTTPDVRTALAEVVGPYAIKAWKDIESKDGKLGTNHNHYLKMWALTHPRLHADYIMVDEAQDSNALTTGIVRDQIKHGAQVITVGDPNQAINGWRGATDQMDAFEGQRVRLTTSFRFGPAVADEANAWLTYLGSTMRLSGHSALATRVGSLTELPDAVLCRSNARTVEALIDYHDQGVNARIEGGAQDVRKLAEAAQQLKETGRTWHPDLIAFTAWGQVQDFVETDHAGQDLKTAVRLIDTWGADGIINAIDRQAPEDRARVVLSTAHKAKGLEWNRVKLEDDFPGPRDPGDVDFVATREDAMLAYVAVTRAQQHLDAASLRWVHAAVAAGRRAGQ